MPAKSDLMKICLIFFCNVAVYILFAELPFMKALSILGPDPDLVMPLIEKAINELKLFAASYGR